MRSKRKGVSPIIATVLLIAITIAAGLMVYAWVAGILSSGTSSKLGGVTTLTATVISATSSGTVTLSIQNTGSYDVILSAKSFSSSGALKPNWELLASNGQPVSASISPSTVSPGSNTVTITISNAAAGKSYTFKLLSNCTDVNGNSVIMAPVSFTLTS
jgi:flagellin-like protein